MKKLLVFILVSAMLISFAACGSSGGKDPEPAKPSGSEQGGQSPSGQGGGGQKAETVVYGNDDCGYITIDIYQGVLKGSGNDRDLVDITAWEGDLLASVRIDLLSFSKEDPDFAYAADYLRSMYFRAYNGPDKKYSGETEYEVTLDGQQALKITAETVTSKGVKKYCAGYVTATANGGYVHISVETPRDDAEGIGTSLPTIGELMDLVERTYSRTK